MLPQFLVPSYKQYKRDSDTIATWLASTAYQCGFLKDRSTNQTASQIKTPKLKGRARKLARDAAQNRSGDKQSDSSKSKSTPESPRYLVAIKDFITLAQWIVNSKEVRVEVPASFVSALNRAIVVRKRHHDWWYKQSRKTNDESNKKDQANEGHAYFIGVLEEVRNVLQPIISAGVLKDLSEQPIEESRFERVSEKGHVVNLFENLNVEEPLGGFLESEPTSADQKLNSAPQVRYGVDQVQNLEEVYFAVHCFFNDLDNIRRYLQQVWKGYKQGAFDLVAASITTNTAIEFAKRLQEDFFETFPMHTDFERHINVLYMVLCLAINQTPGFKERPDDEMNFEVYEDAESMLFPAYMLISSFKDVLEPGILPMYKPGYYGVYDASSDRASKSSREKFREDKIILLEMLPDFYVFSLRSSRVPAEDQMTCGIREMVSHNKVPISLAFAAQIFLDIHHVLRKEVNRGFYDLVSSARYVENNIERVLKFHENLRVQNWPKSNDQGLLTILDRISNWVKTDAVENARRKLIKRSKVQAPTTEPFLLFRNHPLYCGLLSYSIKALAQEASIIFVNAWGSVLYCAHLYNALRQEKLMSHRWHDMDLILIMHRIETMFVGNFPNTVDDYFKRFCLAMGHSTTMFAKGKRRANVIASESGPRGLNGLSPISEMFKARYCYGESYTNLSPDDVDTIIKKYADEDDEDDIDFGQAYEGITPKIKINIPEEAPSVHIADELGPLKSPDHSKKTQSSASAGVRPIQLLNSLLNAIQSEMVELNFDHFRIHTFSWRLLRSLKEELGEDLQKIYGPGYLEKENQLPFIVGYIFMTAVQTSKLAGLLAPKKDDVVTSRLLVKASDVVTLMMETGAGGIEHKMLKEHLGMELETPDVLALDAARSPHHESREEEVEKEEVDS